MENWDYRSLEVFDQTAVDEMGKFLSEIDNQAYAQAAELIVTAQKRGNRIYIAGIGKPGSVSAYGASLLSSTGTPTYLLHGTEAVRLVIHGDFTREGAYRAVTEFLQHREGCTAVVACNDLMGEGCMKACVDFGLKVPEEISIVALDNTEYCLCTTPAMTSVDMLQGQVGQEAANFVIDRMINKRNFQKNMAFSPVLVERDSVCKRSE